jgi:hypothetical protein
MGNLKVTVQPDDRVVTLLLGGQRFRRRLENFFHHYADIKRRLPDARAFDLRLEDRITAVGGEHLGEQ